MTGWADILRPNSTALGATQIWAGGGVVFLHAFVASGLKNHFSFNNRSTITDFKLFNTEADSRSAIQGKKCPVFMEPEGALEPTLSNIHTHSCPL
jgi:hypothetical protein